ncbi:MAG: FtsX-like permease family protein [Thermoguttaceae bacterium]|jgi:putative ABC transport system permease protein
MVLWKFSLREVLCHPGRAALTLLSIVIGVAAVVSVSVATSTTRQAYQEMFTTVTGRAALEIVAAGDSSFDQGVLELVEKTPGVKVAAPIVERRTIMYTEGRRLKLLVLGVDPSKDAAVRDYRLKAGQALSEKEGVQLEAEFAKTLGLKPGDEVKLLTKRGNRRIDVVGILEAQGVAALRMGGLMLMPIKTAQSFFRIKGKLDGIQVVLHDSANVDQVLADLNRQLPTGITARKPPTNSQLVEETLSSSEQGLRLASAFSLLLAAFIILNTSLMNVGERRRQLAVMRAIGATRRQVSRLIHGESLMMGIVGTVIGILVGLAGAQLLTNALTSLLQISLPAMIVTPAPFVLAVVFGLGVAFIGAAVPARRAGQVSPLEGLSPVPHEDMEGASYKSVIAGVILTIGGSGVLLLCILGYLPTLIAVATAVVILVGIVLMLPLILNPLAGLVRSVLEPLLGVETRLAHRQILRHRARTTLTVGVLYIAASTGIGLSNSILDNIRDVRLWYEQALAGDFFVRAMMPDPGSGMSADLPEVLDQEIRQIPGITSIDSTRFVQATAAGESVVLIVRQFTDPDPGYLRFEGGDAATIRNRILEGQVVIGTVLAQKTGLGVGDELPIETLQGVKRLRIAGLFNEYLVGGLSVYMYRPVAEKLVDVQGVDAYLIRADHSKLADVQQQLQALCDKHGVLLHSFSDLSRMIDGMIHGIDGCLWGILILGFFVAAFGVVNTLTMNVLEQTRELGLLRIVAMTRGQVRKAILTQAAMIGAMGLVPGVFAGIAVAYLIHLATLPAIGHPVAFVFRPWLLAACFVVAYLIVLVAAWIPAERAARLELTKALQYE